jgi:hypothetical protein
MKVTGFWLQTLKHTILLLYVEFVSLPCKCRLLQISRVLNQFWVHIDWTLVRFHKLEWVEVIWWLNIGVHAGTIPGYFYLPYGHAVRLLGEDQVAPLIQICIVVVRCTIIERVCVVIWELIRSHYLNISYRTVLKSIFCLNTNRVV